MQSKRRASKCFSYATSKACSTRCSSGTVPRRTSSSQLQKRLARGVLWPPLPADLKAPRRRLRALYAVWPPAGDTKARPEIGLGLRYTGKENWEDKFRPITPELVSNVAGVVAGGGLANAAVLRTKSRFRFSRCRRDCRWGLAGAAVLDAQFSRGAPHPHSHCQPPGTSSRGRLGASDSARHYLSGPQQCRLVETSAVGAWVLTLTLPCRRR